MDMSMKTHLSRLSRLLLLVLLAGAFVAAHPADAVAQDDEAVAETSRESGPIVRRKLLYRSTRTEIAPVVGMTLADAFLRNGLVGLNLGYHLTNEFSFGVTAGYGVLQMETNLYENMQQTLEGDPRLDDISLSYIQWLASLEFSYVPIFGKFSIADSLISNYDIHLLIGPVFVGEQVVAAAEGGETDDALAGLRPGLNAGIGMRFFMSDGFSLNLQVRDLIYSRAEVSAQTGDPELSNTVLVSLSGSFFFPGEVKISR